MRGVLQSDMRPQPHGLGWKRVADESAIPWPTHAERGCVNTARLERTVKAKKSMPVEEHAEVQIPAKRPRHAGAQSLCCATDSWQRFWTGDTHGVGID